MLKQVLRSSQSPSPAALRSFVLSRVDARLSARLFSTSLVATTTAPSSTAAPGGKTPSWWRLRGAPAIAARSKNHKERDAAKGPYKHRRGYKEILEAAAPFDHGISVKELYQLVRGKTREDGNLVVNTKCHLRKMVKQLVDQRSMYYRIHESSKRDKKQFVLMAGKKPRYNPFPPSYLTEKAPTPKFKPKHLLARQKLLRHRYLEQLRFENFNLKRLIPKFDDMKFNQVKIK